MFCKDHNSDIDTYYIASQCIPRTSKPKIAGGMIMANHIRNSQYSDTESGRIMAVPDTVLYMTSNVGPKLNISE